MSMMKLAATITVMSALAGGAAEAQQGNTISVPVAGLRDSNGEVRCGLYNSAATFPKDGQQLMGVTARIVGQQATCVFGNVPPGTYAVALFQATNGETTMPTGLFGQPKVAYGFSRNATGSMGPPAFNAAAYAYPGGPSVWPVTVTYP